MACNFPILQVFPQEPLENRVKSSHPEGVPYLIQECWHVATRLPMPEKVILVEADGTYLCKSFGFVLNVSYSVDMCFSYSPGDTCNWKTTRVTSLMADVS